MSVTYSVSGYIPEDEIWNKMKAVWNACNEANISVPKEVNEFFDYANPNDLPGLEVSIKSAIQEKITDHSQYWEIDLNKLLRKDIRFIRFMVSH